MQSPKAQNDFGVEFPKMEVPKSNLNKDLLENLKIRSRKYS